MTKVIRDCVHGDIELTAEEIRILDTLQMQRLRGIKQLGAAYLVYPTALHTRFDHCIGTAWIAKRMLSLLAGKSLAVSDLDARAISIAALVHDVSHLPFGHTFEDERRVFDRHDSRERLALALDQGELGRVLRRSRLLDPVMRVLGGSCEHSPSGRVPSLEGYGHELVTGAVSADLADYLKRDAKFCGLSQAYDERVFRYLELDCSGRLVFRVGRDGDIREDALSEIISLLRMRYFLSERVYYHHTKVAAGAMISKAVEIGKSDGTITLESLSTMDDWSLLYSLESSDHPVASRLAQMVRRRQLYKRGYVLHRVARRKGDRASQEVVSYLSRTYHFDEQARREAELTLCRECGLCDGQIIIYCPSPDMQLKEANVPITGNVEGSMSLSEFADRSSELQVLMDAHRRLWRFYVFVAPEVSDRVELVIRACEEYFGFINEYSRRRKGE